MASTALMEAATAIDALFAFIDSDKLKLVRADAELALRERAVALYHILITVGCLSQADLFTRIDRDRSGTLEREELELCLTSERPPRSDCAQA